MSKGDKLLTKRFGYTSPGWNTLSFFEHTVFHFFQERDCFLSFFTNPQGC